MDVINEITSELQAEFNEFGNGENFDAWLYNNPEKLGRVAYEVMGGYVGGELEIENEGI